MLVGLAGPAISLRAGDEAEFPAAEAMRFIAAGYASPVEQVERAVANKPAERRKRGKA